MRNKRTIHIDRGQKVEGPGEHRRLPLNRSDCFNGVRPCPYVTCRFNLYLDVTPNGSILLNFPDQEVWEVEDSLCALDHIVRSGMTLEQIGKCFNLTRERIRQIEDIAKQKLQTYMDQIGLSKALLETIFELERKAPNDNELHAPG
jgi:hypothetical protein